MKALVCSSHGRAALTVYVLCVLAALCVLADLGRAEQPGGTIGYPRPFSFREINPKNLPYLNEMAMVVSDLHLRTRRGAELEFKQRHPSRPVLVQINTEGLGLWGTWICLPEQRLDDIGLTSPLSLKAFDELKKQVYPIIDFPGYWVYEAGADTTGTIAGNQEIVTVGVTDTEPFEPSSHPHSVNRLNRPNFMKDIVICPRDTNGNLDWLGAEFGSVLAVDVADKTIQIRRWRTRREARPKHEAGTYLAPNANQIVLPAFPDVWTRYLHLREEEYVTPFLPNVTRHCPVDPRTGLNAAQWLARHWGNVKRSEYAEADGYVFDVSAGTFHPSTRISQQSDCDVDGKPDYFYFDGLDFWALGMFDFFTCLRDGIVGKFDGLGEDLVLVSDSNTNEEARFFNLLNGAEYEFGTVNPFRPVTHKYSSNLDRYLLWSTRARTPRVSYVHNKYPTDTYHGGSDKDMAFYMHDNYYRLDMATACMGTGYVGKNVSRPGGNPATAYPERKQQIVEFGTALPLDWDEYHCGDEDKRNWLGMPLAAPVRLTDHLESREIPVRTDRPSIALHVAQDYEAAVLDSSDDKAIHVNVQEIQPWHDTNFKIRLALPTDLVEKGREYTVRFRSRAPSPYAKIDPKYMSIPRNLTVRLSVDATIGLAQETLVFEHEREIFLTLTAPADGAGQLEFGVAEEPGVIELSSIRLYKGCADVMYRRFDNGVVLLNGSATTPFNFDLGTLFPGETYRRIRGHQDPVHNSGELVIAPLTLNPRDGIMLQRAGEGQ
jgi:hypothetical protein